MGLFDDELRRTEKINYLTRDTRTSSLTSRDYDELVQYRKLQRAQRHAALLMRQQRQQEHRKPSVVEEVDPEPYYDSVGIELEAW